MSEEWEERRVDKRCYNCRFSDGTACKRHAPVFGKTPNGVDTYKYPVGVYRQCGDYEPERREE